MTFPPLDDRLVEPETRQEMVRGQLMMSPPSHPEHGDPHFTLDYLVRAHIKPGYVGSTDMLTRYNLKSDFAADTTVRQAGVNPETGERYLEELAFEVANTQRMGQLRARGEDMAARGVRRIFVVFVKTGEVKEWTNGVFQALPGDLIEDPCLTRPLPVRAILDAAAADNAVALALIHKGNAVLAQREEQILTAERRRAIYDLCEVLGIDLDAARQTYVEQLDLSGLAEMQTHLKQHRSWPT